MNQNQKADDSWQGFLSPFKLTILAINLICFGASVVLFVFSRGHILLLIGTGLYSLGGSIGAIVASVQKKRWEKEKNA